MSAEVFDPRTITWKDASGFENGRDGHRATPLDDGTVLVVGGMTSYPGDPSRAEVFDPGSGKWRRAGSLPQPLYGLSLTSLPGRALAVGGFSLAGGVSGAAYLFDPRTSAWTSAGQLHTARFGHTATRLEDGRVVVTGGWNRRSLDSVEIYEPARSSWTVAGKLEQARHTHTATLLPGGSLLITGGQNGAVLEAGFYLSGIPVPTIETFDPSTGQSRVAGRLGSPHFYHSASLLPGGRVLLLGGLIDAAQIPARGDLGYAIVAFPR
jgi:hypothetical protein